MTVTIKDIAAKAGVSRGTVDRALHNRKDVNPEVAKRIRRIVDAMGYIPNRAGKALAARKQPIRFGCLLPDKDNPFFNDVIKGFRRAEAELKDYGVSVELIHIRGFDVQTHIAAIKKAAKKRYKGMCITTLDLPEVQREVFALTQGGTPVVSVNTDIPDSGRICYVGTDYEKAGYTAAGMLSLITKEKQKLLIVSGSFHIRGHNDRIKGFCTGLAEHGIAYEIIKTVEAFDSNEDSYILTHTILSKHPEITGVFVVAGGVPGVYRAIKELGRSSIVPLVFDDLPEIKKIIKEGGIGFTICQEPETQGYIGIMRLFGYLMEEGKKLPDDYITQTIIKIAGNL